jgi:hypothetical protein
MSKIIAVFLAAFSLAVAAQDNRQVTSVGELVGCWSKVVFSEQAKSKINEIDYPEARYQYFCFETDGTLRTVGSSAPIQTTPAELRTASAALPKVITAQIAKPGIVVLARSDSTATTAWLTVLTQRAMQFDGKSIPKDSLDVAKQKAVYWRYLVRMREDE